MLTLYLSNVNQVKHTVNCSALFHINGLKTLSTECKKQERHISASTEHKNQDECEMRESGRGFQGNIGEIKRHMQLLDHFRLMSRKLIWETLLCAIAQISVICKKRLKVGRSEAQ